MKVPLLGITVVNRMDKPEGVTVEFTVNDEGHLCCKAKFAYYAQLNADDADAVLSADNGAEYMMRMAEDVVSELLYGARQSINRSDSWPSADRKRV